MRRVGVELPIALVALLALGLVVSCSSDGDPAGGDNDRRGLTTDEANLLAAALFNNFDAGGATYEMTATYTATGDTIEMSGVVDWKNHLAQGTVSATGLEEPVTEVFWNLSTVIERRPSFADELAAAGRADAMFIARPEAPTERELDGLLHLLVRLAAEQRDNPQLLRQNPLARYVRSDEVRGKPVSVFAYEGSLLWVDGSGFILRFMGDTPDSTRPITVDLLTLGPHQVSLPPDAQVVAYDDVAAAYDQALDESTTANAG